MHFKQLMIYFWLCTLLILSALLVTNWFHRRAHSADNYPRSIASPLLPGEWVLNESACVFYDENLSSDTRPLLVTTDKHLVKLPV